MSWAKQVQSLRAATVMRIDLSMRGMQIVDATRATAGGLTDDPELVEAVLDEIFGLGPLEALLKDTEIGEILVAADGSINVVRDGATAMAERGFRDAQHARRIIDRVLASQDLVLDAGTPEIRTTMGDGSKVEAAFANGQTTFRIVRPPRTD